MGSIKEELKAYQPTQDAYLDAKKTIIV